MLQAGFKEQDNGSNMVAKSNIRHELPASVDRADDDRFRDPQPRIHPSSELKSCRMGRYSAVGERVILREVSLGDFSYIERHAEGIYASIGKFCSIASNTRINALEHPMERVTTHKITYRPNEYFRFRGIDNEFRQRRRNRHVKIGNDVWIGHGAVILPGVNVGDGAVIGANAVVSEDVIAYTVVAGVPARKLKNRFPERIAASLAKMEWWNWPLEQIFEAIPDMQKLDAEAFIDKWKNF